MSVFRWESSTLIRLIETTRELRLEQEDSWSFLVSGNESGSVRLSLYQTGENDAFFLTLVDRHSDEWLVIAADSEVEALDEYEQLRSNYEQEEREWNEEFIRTLRGEVEAALDRNGEISFDLGDPDQNADCCKMSLVKDDLGLQESTYCGVSTWTRTTQPTEVL